MNHVRDLDFGPTAGSCECRGNGVIVNQSGILAFCACEVGVRERAQNPVGVSRYVGRSAREMVSALQIKLKENHIGED